MNQELGRLYYRFALKQANESNLTRAIECLQISLAMDCKNEKALKLMDLCLYERDKIDLATGDIYMPVETSKTLNGASSALKELCSPDVTRYRLNKAISVMKKLPHKSVRVLNILGCLYAINGNHGKSAHFFALASEKDRGNMLASKALADVLTDVSIKGGFFWRNYEKLLRIIRN